MNSAHYYLKISASIVMLQTQKGPKRERRTIKSENIREFFSFLFFSLTHDKNK